LQLSRRRLPTRPGDVRRVAARLTRSAMSMRKKRRVSNPASRIAESDNGSTK
jgi:hypothetical protein